MTEQTIPELPPVKIAFVIDGEVIDVLHTDDRLGAIFLSQPIVLDVSAWYVENPGGTLVKYTYDGSAFTAPEEVAVLTNN